MADRMRLASAAARVGSADPQSAGKPADSKKSAAPIYGGWFRVRIGGSKWLRALPGGNRLWGSRPVFSTAKHPEVLIYGRRMRLATAAARVGSADPQSAGKPADSKTLAASIYGGQRSSIGCAAAGCGAVSSSLPTTKYPEALIYGRRVRVAGASSWLPGLPAGAGGRLRRDRWRRRSPR